MKRSIDLFASFALLCIASLTILFGAVWSLSDHRLQFHPKAGRCRLTVSHPELKALMVSALEIKV